jgi:O-antigen/teichoic acid export membrane protein
MVDMIGNARSASEEAQDFRRQMGQISRQSGIFFAGTMFTAAVGYLFRVYLARALGAEALGIYALGMTIVGFFGVFNTLGLPQSAVRFVAMYRATGKTEQLRGFLGGGFLILLTSNLLLGGLVLLVGPWLAVRFYHTPAIMPFLSLFALIMLFGVLNTFLGQALVGYKEVARRTLISDFIGAPLMMVFTLALVALGAGLWGYIFAQVLSSAAVLVLLFVMVWRLTPGMAQLFSGSFPRLHKEEISFSAIMLGMAFLAFLTSQTDRVLIGFYLNAREVGIYAMAAALVTFVPVILQSINQIFSPTIAELHSRGEHELLGRIFQTLTKWIIGLTAPLAAVMMLFARPLMRIFGPEFEIGWPILIIGTLGQLVNCGVGSVGYLLLMSGNQRRLFRVQAVTACVMVLLNLVLIPRWGITGAAVAAALATVLANAWNLKQVHSALGLFPYNRSYLRLALPVAASGGVLLPLRASFAIAWPDWVVIAVGLVVAYLVFGGLALMFGLDADDRLVAQAIWSRMKGMLPRLEVGV